MTDEVPPDRRPPQDPILRKGKPTVNKEIPKSTDAIELINRGQQLLLELDRQHKRTHDAIVDALKPDPQSWRQVRAAHTDYVKAFAELTQLSKRLNRLIQEENPELIIPQTPPEMATFGDVVTQKRRR